jgi:hypothetical protein
LYPIWDSVSKNYRAAGPETILAKPEQFYFNLLILDPEENVVVKVDTADRERDGAVRESESERAALFCRRALHVCPLEARLCKILAASERLGV